LPFSAIPAGVIGLFTHLPIAKRLNTAMKKLPGWFALLKARFVIHQADNKSKGLRPYSRRKQRLVVRNFPDTGLGGDLSRSHAVERNLNHR
jgi:hypothetical protein